MADSIKAKIIAAQLTAMKALEANGTVRQVSRGTNLNLNIAIRPSIQLYVGPERPFGKADNRGRTFHFDICYKLLNSDARDVAASSDVIIPQMQQIAETNIQIGGLATIVEGGEEIPFLNEADQPLGGSLLQYTIEYRRLLGDPFTTY